MKRVEKLRRLKGSRSYADIAKELGCSPENVRKIIDHGTEPRFTLGVELARILGVAPEWLADDSADWPPERYDATDRILERLRPDLQAYLAQTDFELDVKPIMMVLESIHSSTRPQVIEAIKSVLAVYRDGVRIGRDIQAESTNPSGDAPSDTEPVGDRVSRSLGRRSRETG